MLGENTDALVLVGTSMERDNRGQNNGRHTKLHADHKLLDLHAPCDRCKRTDAKADKPGTIHRPHMRNQADADKLKTRRLLIKSQISYRR